MIPRRNLALAGLIHSILLAIPTGASADPAWWSIHGVKNNSPASNLSPATVGQAKYLAAKALKELKPKLSLAAYASLEADVAAIVDLTWPATQAEFEAQKSILALGQLKAISKPFYDHLRSFDNQWVDLRMHWLGTRIHEPTPSNPFAYSPYPWTESVSDDVNKAFATVGQLKAVFALPLESWVTPTVTNPALPWGPVDSDGDGLSDVTEVALGTNPLLADTDGDGHPDGMDEFPLDPSKWNSPGPVITLTEPVGAVEIP